MPRRSPADGQLTVNALDQLLGEQRSLLVLLDRAALFRKVSAAARLAGELDVAMVGDACGGGAIVLRGHVGLRSDGLRELLVPSGRGLGGSRWRYRKPLDCAGIG
jgi:hypothetical protein